MKHGGDCRAVTWVSVDKEVESLTLVLLWHVGHVGMQFMFDMYAVNRNLRSSKYEELTQSQRWIECYFYREESHSSLYVFKWISYERQWNNKLFTAKI